VKNKTCNHKFIFLRQDKKNIGFDRNPVWHIEDIFFCEKCLEYHRVLVEEHTPRTDSFEMRVKRMR
jgi:hypothetical protein